MAPPTSLSQEEASAVVVYCLEDGLFYARLNGAMHDHYAAEGNSDFLIAPYVPFMVLFRNTLVKLPPMVGKGGVIVLYRGTRLSASALAEYDLHGDGDDVYVVFSGFTSCSKNLTTAYSFSQLGAQENIPVIFVVKARLGKLIAPFSAFPEEEEVLLKFDDKFRVTAREKGGASLGLDDPDIEVVHLNEVVTKRPW